MYKASSITGNLKWCCSRKINRWKSAINKLHPG